MVTTTTISISERFKKWWKVVWLEDNGKSDLYLLVGAATKRCVPREAAAQHNPELTVLHKLATCADRGLEMF